MNHCPFAQKCGAVAVSDRIKRPSSELRTGEPAVPPQLPAVARGPLCSEVT
jgi:hypothetical protein